MASGTSVSQLEMQLQSARKSILFMETQHANTLRGLHQEIQQLQKKCSGKPFSLLCVGMLSSCFSCILCQNLLKHASPTFSK